MWTAIQTVLLDVDGVLTDGSLALGAHRNGQACSEDSVIEEVYKVFHAHDGAMIKRAIAAGIAVGVVSGRSSAALEHRCQALGMSPCLMDVGDKVAAVQALCLENQWDIKSLAYIGDDLPDMGLMRHVGLPVAVADARRPLRRAARFVCREAGGRGAVAEFLEYLMRKQGKFITYQEGFHG